MCVQPQNHENEVKANSNEEKKEAINVKKNGCTNCSNNCGKSLSTGQKIMLTVIPKD